MTACNQLHGSFPLWVAALPVARTGAKAAFVRVRWTRQMAHQRVQWRRVAGKQTHRQGPACRRNPSSPGACVVRTSRQIFLFGSFSVASVLEHRMNRRLPPSFALISSTAWPVVARSSEEVQNDVTRAALFAPASPESRKAASDTETPHPVKRVMPSCLRWSCRRSAHFRRRQFRPFARFTHPTG